MSATFIIGLILALVTVLIAANGIEQYKTKLEHERHQLLMQLATILQEDDDLLTNTVGLPMSNTIIAMLLKRNISVMEQIIELMPESTRMPPRLEETKLHLESVDLQVKGRPELVIPASDDHIAALIQSIKKLRHIMLRQKTKGNINAQDHLEEDKVYSFFLLKIFVEYKINQGIEAITNKKLGSARQFMEKALKTLNEESAFPEYVETKRKEVYERLEHINNLKLERREKLEELESESDEPLDALEDIELVFTQTKKKW